MTSFYDLYFSEFFSLYETFLGEKNTSGDNNTIKQPRTEQFPLPLSPIIRVRSSEARSASPISVSSQHEALSPGQVIPESPTTSHVPVSPASSTMSSVIPSISGVQFPQDKLTQGIYLDL